MKKSTKMLHDLEVIKARVSEINHGQLDYNTELYELRRERNAIHTEALSCLVGRAFRNNSLVFLVIDVPSIDESGYMNIYEIPVLEILEVYNPISNLSTFEILQDTIYSRCIDTDDVYESFVKEGNVEISVSEFLGEASKAMMDTIHNVNIRSEELEEANCY